MKVDDICKSPFTFGFREAVGVVWRRLDGVGLVIGMMVPVDELEGLPRHPEEPADFMDCHPRSAGVPQGVRHYICAKSSKSTRVTETLIDAFDWLPLPLDYVVSGNTKTVPAAHMP